MATVACDRVLTPAFASPFAPASALSWALSVAVMLSRLLEENSAFSSLLVVRIDWNREALPAALRRDTETVLS